jgi:hypothetical protein
MLYQILMYGVIVACCVAVLHPGIPDNLVQRVGLSLISFGALSEAHGGSPNGQLLLVVGISLLALGTVFKLMSTKPHHPS